MDELLQSTKEQWISELFINISDNNLESIADFIYDENLFSTICVKRGDVLYLTKSLSEVGVTPDIIDKNPYSPFDNGRMHQISLSNPAPIMFVCFPSLIFLISMSFLSFHQAFSKDRKALRTCYSLGYSKAFIFVAYVFPTLLVFAIAYLCCYPLSIMAWGYDILSNGFSFMPEMQWPMVLILFGLTAVIGLTALLGFRRIFKKK